MGKFRVYAQFFCVLTFLGLHLLSWPAADGLCTHPAHESNEKITFSSPFMDETYPENTTATFFCENSTEKDSFKAAVCDVNGTWIFSYTPNVINCALAPSNRCQRPFKKGVNPSLNSLIYDATCFSLHRGINDTSLDSFMEECDTGPFRADKYPHATTGLLQEEIRGLCEAFFLPSETRSATRKILLAVQPNKSDSSMWENFKNLLKSFFSKSKDENGPPKCYYLECSSNPKLSSVEFDECDADQNYWICKHNISSCGIPSHPLHATMNYSNIYIGDNATYQCQEGYLVDISPKRTCQKDGYWSKKPICQAVDCGKPDVNDNVTYELTTNRTTYRNWLMHKCALPGQRINGSEYRMCLPNGKWSGESPVCQTPPVQPERDAKIAHFGKNSSEVNPGEMDLLNLIIGIIAGVTLFLIVLMWLVLAVLLRHHKRKLNG